MTMPTVLIVDDSAPRRRLHATLVSNQLNYAYLEAETSEQAFDLITIDKSNSIFAVLLDLSMRETDGRQALQRLLALRPNLPVIVVTPTDTTDDIVDVVRLGAFDYLIEPASTKLLHSALHKAFLLHMLQNEKASLRHEPAAASGFSQWVGQGAASEACLKLGRRAAASDINVIITGESGVGKDMMAQAIHDDSARRGKPFIAVNCSAIPTELSEAALFGDMCRSFTGVATGALGKLQEADGGTLFLDKIDELPPSAQVKLLRFFLLRTLQNRKTESAGSARTTPVNVRIIAATTRDPLQAMRQGLLREDLFHRLNVFPIHIPPLRQRPDDILPLTEAFISRYAARENKTLKGCDKPTRQWLQSHNWPGNVHELENRIYRAVLICETPYLTLDSFLTPHELPPGTPDAVSDGAPAPQIGLLKTDGGFKTMEQLKAEAEQAALRFCEGNVVQAAKLLQVGKSTLYRHKQNGIV
jgi:DNA-binding NtrC family response regulator